MKLKNLKNKPIHFFNTSSFKKITFKDLKKIKKNFKKEKGTLSG